MSISSVGSNNMVAYLRSLLQQGPSGSANGVSDPLASLFTACTGMNGDASGNAAASPAGGGSGPWSSAIDPNTLSALLAVQGQQGNTGSATSSLQSLFAKFDTNGDGQISQSEFESAIGPNADQSQVDALFQKIDANGDGAISQDELGSAIQTAQNHSHHHHHRHMHADAASGSGADQGGLTSLLSATGADGATTQTTSNADGSSTTTISYADGSTVSMTTPAVANGPSSGGTSGQNNSSLDSNFLERLIKLQSQLLAQPVSTTSAIA